MVYIAWERNRGDIKSYIFLIKTALMLLFYECEHYISEVFKHFTMKGKRTVTFIVILLLSG